MRHVLLGQVTILFVDVFEQVHLQQIGQRELKRARLLKERSAALKEKEQALLKKYGLTARL